MVLGEEQQAVELAPWGRTKQETGAQVDYVNVINRQVEFPCPTLEETPAKLLQREYLLYDVAVMEGSTNTYRPIPDLIAAGQNLNMMRSFTYFRGTVKLRIVINSTPNYYGYFKLCWLPDCNSEGDGQWTNADPTLIDVSSTQVTEVSYPFVSNRDFWIVGSAFQGPLVYLEQTMFKKLDSTQPALNMKIYASFSDVCLAGAQLQSAPGKYNRDDYLSPQQSLIEHGYDPWDMGDIDKISQDFSSLVNGAAVGASLAAPEFAPAFFLAAEVTKATSKFIGWTWDQFTDGDKHETGTVDPGASRLQSYGNISGGVYGPTLMMESSPQDMKPPSHLGDGSIRHRIALLARVPAIKQTMLFASSDNTDHEVKFLPWTGAPDNLSLFTSYLDHWSYLFRFWRGSVKIKMSFFTSPFITASFEIRVFHNRGGPLPVVAAQVQYRRLIQIRGSMEVGFVVPYLNDVPYVSLNAWDDPQPYTLQIQQITSSTQTGDQVPYVGVVIQVAGGSDFQFKSLRSPQPDLPFVPERRAKLQSSVRKDFYNCDFDNLLGGSTSYQRFEPLWEDRATIEDCCFRYSRRPPDNRSIALWSWQTFIDYDLYDFVMASFMYARGAIRFKHPLIANVVGRANLLSTITQGVTLTPNASGNGTVAINSDQNGVLEFEYPFQSEVNWLQNPNCSPAVTFVQVPANVSITLSELYAAGGRDFQLAFLLPPKIYSVYPTARV